MGVVGIGCLLCSVYYFFCVNNDIWFQRNECECRLHICRNFSLLELVSKPDSLLLEDKRSKTSSEGHSTKVLLFIKLSYTAEPYSVVASYVNNLLDMDEIAHC